MSKQRLQEMVKSKLSRYLDIDDILQEDIQEKIVTSIKNEDNDFFINRSYGLLSPNVHLENLVFENVCSYLYNEYKDVVIFEKDTKLDIKTIIASSLSLIQRPNLKKPSEAVQGFSEPHHDDSYTTIARFERELAFKPSWGNTTDKGGIIFEGLLPYKIEINPLPRKYLTHHIWTNSFYINEPFIQGFHANINSIEASYTLWMNSELLTILGLTLDNYKNGLRALNAQGEIILKFRHWRDQLIDKGSYFVGTNANIAKLEGCDLVLRTDYFDKLKMIIPNLVYYVQVTDT